MKLPHLPIKTCLLGAILALAAMLSGCTTDADKKWIADRAAVLTGMKNPDTGKRYTPDEATRAAQAENNYGQFSVANMMGAPAVGVLQDNEHHFTSNALIPAHVNPPSSMGPLHSFVQPSTVCPPTMNH